MVRLHFPEYYKGFLFLDVVFTKSVSYHHSSNSFDLNCNELVSESHNLKHSDKKKVGSAFPNIGQNNIFSFRCRICLAFSHLYLEIYCCPDP